MASANDKGALLEDAVRMIEQAILRSESNLRESDLTIETRKIINASGVHHEIDVYVKIHNARGYDGIFVFECKNWKDKVGKNEIVVFSEKIKVSGAQRGFFVATGFTADATAQAALDPRIELAHATAQELSTYQSLTYLHWLVVNYGTVSVTFGGAGSKSTDAGELTPIDFANAKTILDGNEINLLEYVTKWRDDAQNRRTQKWGSPIQPAGDYPLVAEETRDFTAGELMIDGKEHRTASIRVEMTVTVVRPAITARVEVEGRGVALKLEPVKVGEGTISTWLTHAPGIPSADI